MSTIHPMGSTFPDEPEDDAWLEALLEAPEPAIADDGFSRRVLAALPAPESHWRRRAALHALTSGIAAVCVVAVGGTEPLLALLEPFAEPLGASAMGLALSLAVLGGLAWFPLSFALED